MNHRLECKCGALRGLVAAPERCTRVVCYCKDCQAFAHFLGQPGILDEHGGSGVVVAHPEQLSFTAGRAHLACMSLSPKGLLRWYASCCNTPIGNVGRNPKMAFVGLSEACLQDPATKLEQSFGPVRMRSMTKGATGKVASSGLGAVAPMSRLVASLLKARLTGSYRRTPFFGADGAPLVQPTVLSLQQRRQLP